MTDLNKEFSSILKLMDTYNNIEKWKRFYPIYQQNRSDSFTTVGFHDYLTKKHFLSDLRSHDVAEHLADMKLYIKRELNTLQDSNKKS